MKHKFICLLCATMAMSGAMAQPVGFTIKEQNAPYTVEENTGPRADFNKKLSTPAKEAPEAVTIPEGRCYSYALDTKVVDGNGMMGISAMATEIYFEEDNSTVYVKNLVYFGADGSYAKGTLTSGDSRNGIITFQNGVEYADGSRAYIGIQDENGYLVADRDESHTFSFNINNGTITSTDEHAIKSHFYLMGYKGNYLNGYNIDYSFTKKNPVINPEVPESVEMKKYLVSCPALHNIQAHETVIQTGVDENNLYIHNIVPGIPESLLKAIRIGSRITIKGGDFGVYGNAYLSIYSADYAFDEEGLSLRVMPNRDIDLTYIEDTGRIICNNDDELIVITAGSTLIATYYNPTFTLFDTESGVKIPETAETTNTILKSTDMFYDENPSQNTYVAYQVSIARDGNDFYFKGLYPENTELAFKGTLENGKINVSVPQYMGEGNDNSLVFFYKADHKVNVLTYPPVAYYDVLDNNEILSFDYDPATNNITYDGSAAVALYGGEVVRGIDHPQWTKFDQEVNTMPEGLELKPYSLESSHNYNYQRSYDVESSLLKVANEGNDYYLQGFDLEEGRTCVVKGHIEGDKFIVPLPQFVSTKANNMMLYACSVDANNNITRLEQNQIVFDYDAQKDRFSSSETILFASILGENLYFYEKPVITLYAPKESCRPANPKGDPDDIWSNAQNMTAWTFPAIDTENNYLYVEDLAYSVYLDDELYTFDAGTYWRDFTEDTTEVPMSQVSPSFDKYRNSRRIHLAVRPNETIGVQTIFYNPVSGSRTVSDIVNYNIHTGEFYVRNTGIEDVFNHDNDIISTTTTYYDLTGCKVVNPEKNSVCIAVSIDTSGKRITRKVLIR